MKDKEFKEKYDITGSRSRIKNFKKALNSDMTFTVKGEGEQRYRLQDDKIIKVKMDYGTISRRSDGSFWCGQKLLLKGDSLPSK